MALDLELTGGGGGRGGSPQAALQSNITGDALAMWSLDQIVGSSAYSGGDRSGHGYNLSSVNAALSFPDIIPGKTAMWTWPSESPVAAEPVGMVAPAAVAALQLKGQMSLTFRVQKALWPAGNTGAWTKYEYCVACGNGNDATAAGNTCFAVYLSQGGTSGQIGYYAENGVHAGISFQTSMKLGSGALTTDGLWHFVSFRRTAAGVVTLGVDGSYQTSGALALPTGGTTSKINLGRPPYTPGAGSPDVGLIGGLKDVCVWPGLLTDAQLLRLRRQSMGPFFLS